MVRLLPFVLALSMAAPALAAPPPAATSAPPGPAATQAEVASLQQQVAALTRRMADLSARLGDDSNATVLRYLADGKRAMLGIAVSPAGGADRVVAVTPGGPAQRAGIEVGDRITAIDGVPVPTRAGAGSAGSGHFDAGKPVTLTVDRGGRVLHVKVTPERMQDDSIPALLGAVVQQATELPVPQAFPRQPDVAIGQSFPNGRSISAFEKEAQAAITRALGDSAGPWWGLDLAPLNPDLGQYFGTSAGVLVLSRNQKLFPELRPGDVIRFVDGQSVASPSGAMRALRAVPSGKPIDLAILRHGKALRLSITAPASSATLPPLPPIHLRMAIAKPFRVM